jgi:hypothetical protein
MQAITPRTAAEIAAEPIALNELLSQVPPTTCFGDDNREAINAQIRVIEENMTLDKLLMEYEEGNAHIFNSALDALEWLSDDGLPLSEHWSEMVEDHLAAA